jgi:uncharacterized protein (TIGR03066 family)
LGRASACDSARSGSSSSPWQCCRLSVEQVSEPNAGVHSWQGGDRQEFKGKSMRCVVLCAFSLFLLPIYGCSSNTQKIQGIWELESGVEPLTEGTWEFAPDGKVKVGGKLLGQPFTDEGTYSINGNIITFNMNVTKVSDRTRILELTDTRLVMKDDSGTEAVFKKRK